MSAVHKASLRILCVLALGLCASAQSPQALSWLHGALLDRAPVVVRARYLRSEVLPLGGDRIAVFELVRVHAGKNPPRTLRVLGLLDRRGQLNDLDKLLFLEPMSSGLVHRLVDLVDLTPADQPSAEELLRDVLALGALKNPLERRTQRLNLALKHLPCPSVFASRVACNELLDLHQVSPGIFTRRHLAAIEAAREKLPAESLGDHRRLVRALGQSLGLPFQGLELAFPEGEERNAFLRARLRMEELAGNEAAEVRFLDEMAERFGPNLLGYMEAIAADGSAALRLCAIGWIGEFGLASAANRLLDRLPQLRGLERQKAIEALGKLGSRSAFAALSAALEDQGLRETALVALARIDGPKERALLAKRKAESADPAEQALLSELLSEAFRRTEISRRLAVAERWR